MFRKLVCIGFFFLQGLPAHGAPANAAPKSFQDAICGALKGTALEPSIPPHNTLVPALNPWPPLDESSIIIDTNMAIASDSMPEIMRINRRTEIRVTDRGQEELKLDGGKYKGFREDPAAAKQYDIILSELERLKVGVPLGKDPRSVGLADREIVTEVFCALSPAGPPVFVTADHGIFLPLFRKTRFARAIPEQEIFRFFYPKGFEVSVGGRTIRVVPVPPRRSTR